MVEEQNVGGGIALNDDWDIEIDNTGDIKTVTGVDEVKKDLSYNIAENINPIIGNKPDEDTAYNIATIVRDTVSSYPNTESLEYMTVRFGKWGDEFDVAIEMIVSINDSPKEMVVTV